MDPHTKLRALLWAGIGVFAIGAVLVLNYFAPLQAASLALYSGIVVSIAGIVCLISPFHRLGLETRGSGALICIAGLGLAVSGLLWPVPVMHSAGPRTLLDEVMPEYHFSERHVARVHAPADCVAEVMTETTFGDISVFYTVLRVRALVYGRLLPASNPIRDKKVLDLMSEPGSGFIQLRKDAREIVLGMAGRPWANQVLHLQRADEFAAFRAPGAIKIAFNLRVEDAGPGWTQVITETRVQALDDAARNSMRRYWRFIYPGTGMIRRVWLNAIRQRAERVTR